MFRRRSIAVARKTGPSRRRLDRCARRALSAPATWLEPRILLSGALIGPPVPAPLVLPASVPSSAIPLTIGSPVTGDLTSLGSDYYQVQPDANGRLIAHAQAVYSPLQIRLSLFDSQGNLLVQSDGQSAGDHDPLIDQHVASDTYFLQVQSLFGTGPYVLSTSLAPASDPAVTLPSYLFQGSYAPIAVGDFTNNGILDIVAPDGVHLGTGDGTFLDPPPNGALVDPSQYTEPSGIAVGDFNGDHKLDAAVALAATDQISISLGDGDGTFQPASFIDLPAGGTPSAIVAGDFGNGHIDLAVADQTLNVVYILDGIGDGTFQLTQTVQVGQGPVSIAMGDFEHDGHTDLAVADQSSGDVTVLSNNGAGTFSPLSPIALPPGSTPTAIVAGDFGTGHLDLAVADSGHGQVEILQGKGDGTFTFTVAFRVGANPYALVAGDLGNGQVDLAVADNNSNDVSVLLGKGDGTFLPAIRTAVGTGPLALAAGDFNRDGRLDLATGNIGSSDISVLLGKGDGTFQEPLANVVGNYPSALATGDFTGNGNLGLAAANQGSDSVTILPGNGDGTFQQPLTASLPQGSAATSIVAADFNGDGRTDLAVAESSLSEVAIFLGNGNGTFQPPVQISVQGAYALATGDFTGHGRVDIAVADAALANGQGGVTILMNNGEGQFVALPTIAFGNPSNSPSPDAIVAGNFTGSGHLDLAVADKITDDVTVFLGNGDGTFRVQPPISFGSSYLFRMSLVTGNFTHDGHTDLAVAATDFANGDSVDVLLGNGDGTFQPLPPISLGYFSVLPVAIVAGDFNHDGNLDLATADFNGSGTDDYSVYLGNGDGTFQAPSPYALGGAGASNALVTGDFTGSGRTDLAIARTSPDDVQVRLSNGDGTFSNPAVTDLVRRETPILADLSGSNSPGVAVVDAAGVILYRAPQPNEPGSFASPVTVNPGDPSRGVAFVSTNLGPLLASVDANDNFISFFALHSTGFVKVAQLATGSEPAQIESAVLDGNGVTDLIVRNAGDGTVSVFPGDGHGWFLPRIDLPVGLGASDVQFADLSQDSRLDIIVTDRLSGELSVLQNLGGGSFAPPVVYRAGQGPYGVNGTGGPSPDFSLDGTTSVAAGIFAPGSFPSLVALNPGSNTLGLLWGTGDGRLSNPMIVPAPGAPLVVRAIHFNSQGGDGLAILTQDGLFIERSDGHGGFQAPQKIDVGFEPNGLTVADVNGDGNPDLLVSNPLGDVLVLYGDDHENFQTAQPLDQQVALAVDAPNGSTPTAFIFADQRTNQLIVQTIGGGTTILGNTSTGLVTPGAVKLADLNNDGIPDLIVANTGSNNVLVFPGLPDGKFGPALNGGNGFYAGTNPVGITVADLTGNGRPDLIIANEGSDDVSILLNEKTADGGFTFVQGPRLKAGDGPVKTAVGDLFGSGVQDLVVADSGSNDVRVLPGIGNGFFNDQNPTVYPVGTNPAWLFVGNFTGGAGQDIATVNAGSNDITVISQLASGAPVMQSVSSGGIDPTAGFQVELTANGQDGLVVANNGSGSFSLLEPGDNGLALTSVLSTSGLPNPSGLALASFSGGNLEFYATTEGEASASLLGFQLEETGGGALGSESSTSSSGGGGAQLVSSNPSSLALIGTLLTVTLNLQTENEATVESGAALVASSGPGSAGQGPLASNALPNQLEETSDSSGSPRDNAPAAPSWARYVTGLDQAIEKARRDADERLLNEQQPAKSKEPPTGLREQNDGARQTSETAFPNPAVSESPRQLPADRNLFEAIDAAIGSLGREQASEARLALPGAPDPTFVETRTPAPRILVPEDAANRSRRLANEHSDRLEVHVSRLAVPVLISGTALGARQLLSRCPKPRSLRLRCRSWP
jgi:hypothetical protein